MTTEGKSTEQQLPESYQSCPHCGQAIRVVVKVEVALAEPDGPEGVLAWRKTLTDDQRRLIEEAEKQGLFLAFDTIMIRIHSIDRRPRNPELSFLKILKSVHPLKAPRFVLDRYIQEFGGRIQFWGGRELAIVVSDGAIRQLVPRPFVRGRSIPGTTARTDVEGAAMEEWLQTRKGFVSGTVPLMLDEIRARFGLSS